MASRATVDEFTAAINNSATVAELQAVVKKYYADDCVQSEAGQPEYKGIKAILEHETYFFENYLDKPTDGKKGLIHIELHNVTIAGSKAFQDQTCRFFMKGAGVLASQKQLVEQDWKDGKIVREVFWHIYKPQK